MTLMRTDAGAAAAAAIASGGAFEIPSSSTANDANETIHDRLSYLSKDLKGRGYFFSK